MLCAGVVTAQFIAGKAVRDTLYLSNLDVSSLPVMVVVTSAFSILGVAASSVALRRTTPGVQVPLWFVGSALLFLLEWALVSVAPRLAAPLVYLHVSGLGPMLGSGFWLVASERFDPHTAKLRFGQIAGIGTLGGLAGGLLVERVAVVSSVGAMLPILAIMNGLCAWAVRSLVGSTESARTTQPNDASSDLMAETPRSGLRVLAQAPYLRHLAALVLLGTIGATLVDYLFKAQAVATLGRGEGLLRLFAIYYTGTSLVTFAVQTAFSRLALERLGLAFAVSTPSLALLAGGLGALVAPGLESAIALRGGESTLRGSLFRAGYELFYTPVSLQEKRAAKSLIDVGFDRLGDAMGGLLVRLVLLLTPTLHHPMLIGLTLTCALSAMVVASRLNRGYLRTLERSLLDRAVELDLRDIADLSTRTVVLQTLSVGRRQGLATTAQRPPTSAPEGSESAATGLFNPVLTDIAVLTSFDRARIVDVLRRPEGLSRALVPHVVPLLAWDAVANDAINALRKVSEEHVGMLTDALIDPGQDFAVRRRLARAFSLCVSQRAVDGLFLGLEDARFEVRFQCGRSLAAIRERNTFVAIDRQRTLDVVRQEVAVSRPVWESHRLLDQMEDPEHLSTVDEFLRDRTNQSLAHVFTLLSLVLQPEPLRIAFRGLHNRDARLHGTSLEYLDGVLPPDIRDRLWPFLDEGPALIRRDRPREEILEDLQHLNESVAINLAEMVEIRERPRGDSTQGTIPAPRHVESGERKV